MTAYLRAFAPSRETPSVPTHQRLTSHFTPPGKPARHSARFDSRGNLGRHWKICDDTVFPRRVLDWAPDTAAAQALLDHHERAHWNYLPWQAAKESAR